MARVDVQHGQVGAFPGEYLDVGCGPLLLPSGNDDRVKTGGVVPVADTRMFPGRGTRRLPTGAGAGRHVIEREHIPPTRGIAEGRVKQRW